MASNDNLLAPAAQKFYSALKCLDGFDKNNDFFDNVSCLDNFLSEYRNVTFVIQKSLANTDLLSIYEKTREKFFKGELSKWFKDKRNEVLKEHPFPLSKMVVATIYDTETSLKLLSKPFTAEDDATYESLIWSLREYLQKSNLIEIYFSVEFVYKEIKSEDNLFDKLLKGINLMHSFLLSLNEKIKDNGPIFHDAMKKINSITMLNVQKSDLFIDDYVYYADEDKFERGSRIRLCLPKVRNPLSNLQIIDIKWENIGFTDIEDKTYRLFLNISFFNANIYVMQNNRIMPTFYIVYEDDTFVIDSFDSSLRTTTYRKINEVANHILDENGNVRAVFFINEMWRYDSTDVLKKKYKDRVATEKPTALFTCHMIYNALKLRSYQFDGSKMCSKDYVINQLRNYQDTTYHPFFLNPIYNAFVSIKNNK